MAIEIERKFLVQSDVWKQHATPVLYRQGYLAINKKFAVRVRIQGEEARLNVKSKETMLTRTEYEYEIPMEDASDMLDRLCEQPIIEKYRYKLAIGPHTWEIDEFLGANAGLIVAEIELGSEDEDFARPDWLGNEVSDDERYFNASLSRHPYSQW